LQTKQRKMDQGIKYYTEKMDSHKKTSYLFDRIPFNFRIVKEEIVFLFALFFIGIGLATQSILTSSILFLIFSTEYSRVYDYRMRLLEECVMNEEMFKIEMGENGFDPNFPHDPLYVTKDDRAQFFSDALSLNRSYHIFNKLSLFVVTGNILRG